MLFLMLTILACETPETQLSPETAEQTTLRFSAIPDQNTTLLKQKYDPIADYLSEALDVPVEYVPVFDYTASVEMFKNGDIQLAWFGGLTGVQARASVPGAHAIAQGAEDTAYFSYFIAHKDTGIERSDAFPLAIAEGNFSFGSDSSTSGRLMPEFFIQQYTGMSPTEFFTEGVSFSGAHDKTAKLVESGQIQAGVLSYKTYDKMVAEGRLDEDTCRIIWKTPEYADYNFTAHPDLEVMFGDGFTQKLQTVLIEMNDPVLLDAFPRSALIEAEDADFDGIAQVAAELGMLR